MESGGSLAFTYETHLNQNHENSKRQWKIDYVINTSDDLMCCEKEICHSKMLIAFLPQPHLLIVSVLFVYVASVPQRVSFTAGRLSCCHFKCFYWQCCGLTVARQKHREASLRKPELDKL